MSSKIKGLRRVGIVGLSTVVAASMMTLSAVSASAAVTVGFTAGSTPTVIRGASSQPAGTLTLGFPNVFALNVDQTFIAASNNCSSSAGIASATEFSALPTAALTGPFNSTGNAAGAAASTIPTFTTTLGSSSADCATAGITDKVTLTLTKASVGTTTDLFKFVLSNIKYNVGATAPLGNLTVTTATALGATSAVNAVVRVGNYMVAPFVAAQQGTTDNALGTVSFVEGAAGTFFPASTPTAVLLTLSTGTFTGSVTPTITMPAGYVTSTPVPSTVAGTTYTFNVTAPATPVKATVSIAGLKLDAPAGPVLVKLTGKVGTLASETVDAANVLDFNDRTGGATRYETAAAIFAAGFSGTHANVVLSGGALFPDALSANYLAGRLGTGTLLTTPSALSSAARAQIIRAGVTTVYITGGTGAVSKGVENTIEAMHVSNLPANPFITTVRLGGATRYDTNLLINEHNFTASNTVLLASGGGFSLTQGFADALAMGPVAYRGTGAANGSYPLILTQGVTLGATENTQLNDFNPTNVIIAGGTGVVSAAIETSLKAQGYTVLRLAGQDRTLTAAAIASWATDGVDDAFGNTGTGIKAPQGFLSNRTFITTGTGFADALAAGPWAGNSSLLIVLSGSPTVVGAGIPAYLGTKAVGLANNEVQVLHALGLTGATSNALMKAAAATIGQ